jgi:hypothetical protein
MTSKTQDTITISLTSERKNLIASSWRELNSARDFSDRPNHDRLRCVAGMRRIDSNWFSLLSNGRHFPNNKPLVLVPGACYLGGRASARALYQA